MTTPYRYLSSHEATQLAHKLAQVFADSPLKNLTRADWEDIAQALVRQMERELAWRLEGTQ